MNIYKNISGSEITTAPFVLSDDISYCVNCSDPFLGDEIIVKL